MQSSLGLYHPLFKDKCDSLLKQIRPNRIRLQMTRAIEEVTGNSVTFTGKLHPSVNACLQQRGLGRSCGTRRLGEDRHKDKLSSWS